MPRVLTRSFALRWSAAGLAVLSLALTALVSTAPPAAAGPSVFHIEGGGFGHGVGMSQYGAHGMAHNGATYQQILTHYFTGTAVQGLQQPDGLRIWIALDPGPNPGTTLTPSGDTQFHVDSPGGQTVASASSGQTVRVNVVNGQFVILVNNAQQGGPVGGGGHNLYATYNGAPMRVDKTGNRYKYGDLEMSITAGGLRLVVENMNMQQYLYGLGEVPSSWEMDALKAQAVAGRTYAKEKIDRLGENRSDCGCGLFGTVSDQNYVGYEKEAATAGDQWVAAVNQTNQETVTYQGAAIQAFYSSSSGGYTENSENVFATALPYLKGVPDPDDSYQNPNFHWTRDYTHDEMQRWLDANSATNVGTLDDIQFLPPFGVSGRVIKVVNDSSGGVRITGSGGVKRVSGGTFQAVVNAGMQADGIGISRALLSTLMVIGGFAAYPVQFLGGVYVSAGKNSDGGRWLVTGAGDGGGPHVRMWTTTGAPIGGGFFAYDNRFVGGVRVAACDLNGDGTSEIVTGAGPGGGPHVRVFLQDGTPVGDGFFAYDPRFVGGVYVACADFNGDGKDEIITGVGPGGGPNVKVFSADGTTLQSFMAYDPGFVGGVRVAGAHLDGTSGPTSIITAPGPGGGPHVRVFTNGQPVGGGFFAYTAQFVGGLYVAAGDTNGDGKDEIITGAGDTGGPHVRIMDRNGNDVKPPFFAFNANDHGARVAFGMLPGPTVVAAEGKGSPPLVRLFPF
ncbi:MAG: SpoIID/LytB domain-containing protein [Actinobacteria bacterium]|nr:SpoIID/LytB domain-containing protein [Actinomycetota bacterium]